MRPDIKIGRRIDDVVDSETGSREYNALSLQMLAGELEATRETWRYSDDPLELELAQRCDELLDFLERLAMAEDGTLTQNQECRACGGAGKYRGVDLCEECNGTGVAASGQEDERA